MSSGPRPPRRPADFLAAAMSRQLKVGPKRNKITIDRDLQVPMRDGTILLADHYAPVTAEPRATVLMRTPYGRGWQMAMMGRPFAERGYHLLLQSCRGTFGSGGTFTPGVDEAADGQDTVAWLREQHWFNGRLATAGRATWPSPRGRWPSIRRPNSPPWPCTSVRTTWPRPASGAARSSCSTCSSGPT